MLSSITRWNHRRILKKHRIPSNIWQSVIQQVRTARHMSGEELEHLRDTTSLFLHEKSIEAVQGIDLTDAMRARIGCEATIPVLNLGLDYYRGFYSVIVYPETYVARDIYQDDAGVLHSEPSARAGEAWDRGPVIISWSAVQSSVAGNNVIIHEMAHKLDMLDGVANGHPPLHRDMDQRQWTAVFSEAFAEHSELVNSGASTEIDAYAATDPAEFFAVSSEVFFESPRVLQKVWPKVYEQLGLYYRQWP